MEKYRISFKNVYRIQHVSVLITRLQKRKKSILKSFTWSSKIRQEFEKELGRVRVDRVKGADNDPNKIERVRVNKAADRDNYGSKIVQVKH